MTEERLIEILEGFTERILERIDKEPISIERLAEINKMTAWGVRRRLMSSLRLNKVYRHVTIKQAQQSGLRTK